MAYFAEGFRSLMTEFAGCFGSTPTANTFLTIVSGWILCNGKRTVSGIIRAAGHEATKSHDAYQNFFSKAKWSMDQLWKIHFLTLYRKMAH